MKYTTQLLRSVKHATQLLKCLSADHLKHTPSLTKFKKIQMPEETVNRAYQSNAWVDQHIL